MIKPTIVTWIIAIFGAVTFLPLLAAQFLMLLKPNSQRTKDIIIGKGEDWRDKTHFKSALAFAWADWLIIFPLLISSYIGVFLGQIWGYILWIVLGYILVLSFGYWKKNTPIHHLDCWLISHISGASFYIGVLPQLFIPFFK